MMIQISNKLRKEVALCMKVYGDDPEQLINRLESLAIEWYCKGLANGIEIERNESAKKLNLFEEVQ